MKILVTGSNGLLGQKLIYALKLNPAVELHATGRGVNRLVDETGYRYWEADLTDKQVCSDTIRGIMPDCIIHTAAMTDVDACERDPEACQKNNVDAVRFLLDACAGLSTHVIYLSTDFVFDGKAGPYRETDPTGPLSVYARSKWHAEQLIMNSGLPWTIIRTMIIYGVTDDRQRSNIVLWTKRSLESGQSIRVISDQLRGPTLAEDLASACVQAALKKSTGLFHVSGKEVMSILDIAYAVADFFKLDKSLIAPVTTAALGQPALRPLRTGFIIEKAEQELGYHPHSLQEGLEIVAKQLASKESS